MTTQTVRHLSAAELEAGLDHIKQSPRETGTLHMIVVRPASDERAVLDVCDVSPERAVHGDRWSAMSKSADISVTLMNTRAAALIAQEQTRWPLAGDQLYVDFDLSEDNLPPGTQVHIGSAVFEITQKPHTGCAKFSARFGPDALAFVNSPEGKRLHLRGIYAKVVQAGVVRAGDTIRKVA